MLSQDLQQRLAHQPLGILPISRGHDAGYDTLDSGNTSRWGIRNWDLVLFTIGRRAGIVEIGCVVDSLGGFPSTSSSTLVPVERLAEADLKRILGLGELFGKVAGV